MILMPAVSIVSLLVPGVRRVWWVPGLGGWTYENVQICELSQSIVSISAAIRIRIGGQAYQRRLRDVQRDGSGHVCARTAPSSLRVRSRRQQGYLREKTQLYPETGRQMRAIGNERMWGSGGRRSWRCVFEVKELAHDQVSFPNSEGASRAWQLTTNAPPLCAACWTIHVPVRSR